MPLITHNIAGGSHADIQEHFQSDTPIDYILEYTYECESLASKYLHSLTFGTNKSWRRFEHQPKYYIVVYAEQPTKQEVLK